LTIIYFNLYYHKADSKQTASRQQSKQQSKQQSRQQSKQQADSTSTNLVMTNYATKMEIYKAVYKNRPVYIQWLDEIKRDGADNEGRVKNPMIEGGLIYTNNDEKYSMLWNACVDVLQGNYDFTGIPRPTDIYYNNNMLNYLQKLKKNLV